MFFVLAVFFVFLHNNCNEVVLRKGAAKSPILLRIRYVRKAKNLKYY